MREGFFTIDGPVMPPGRASFTRTYATAIDITDICAFRHRLNKNITVQCDQPRSIIDVSLESFAIAMQVYRAAAFKSPCRSAAGASNESERQKEGSGNHAGQFLPYRATRDEE